MSSSRGKSPILVFIFAAAVIVAAVIYWLVDRPPINTDTEPERTFAGPSTLLSQTEILPTLDSPIPEHKSAIWCISVQLAWNRLKDDVDCKKTPDPFFLLKSAT
jgi:hypothetical protein